jgi:hypothetical protein
MDYKLLEEEDYLDLLISNKFNKIRKISEEEELYLLVEDLGDNIEKFKSTALPPGGDVSDLTGEIGRRLKDLSTSSKVIGGAAAALAIIYAAHKISKGIRQQLKPKRCRQYKLNSPAQKKCHHQVDIAAFERQVQILKSKIKMCAHSKDKQKCEMKIKKKVAELQHKVAVKKAKITEIDKQLAAMLKVKR